MSANSPCIVYLAYGDMAFCDQAAFSLLTLHARAQKNSLRTVVITDRPERFAGLADEALSIQASELKADMGRFGYVHRVKVQVLRRIAAQFPDAEGWMLIDADTIWRDAPTNLLNELDHGFF